MVSNVPSINGESGNLSPAVSVLIRSLLRKAEAESDDGALVHKAEAVCQHPLAEVLMSLAAEFGAELAVLIELSIVELDRLLERQINKILHHPKFQQLEASWRGVCMIVDQAQEELRFAERAGSTVLIKTRVCSVSKRELFEDFDDALEFDQSSVWKRVYELEFGVAGGEPFGALVADYEFANNPSDLTVLTALSELAEAAFAPVLSLASPSLIDPNLDSFFDLHPTRALAQVETSPDLLKWQSFRESESSRFLGLFLPRILMRVPYRRESHNGFPFQETVSASDGQDYLWGNPAFSFATVLIRAFGESGWFAGIRGSKRGENTGGLVPSLPAESFRTDRIGDVVKSPLETQVDSTLEARLTSLGFIPLSASQGTGMAVFHTNHSCHKPAKSTDPAQDASETMSSMLQYVLCVGRFAHQLKSMGRNLLGSQRSAEEIQSELRRWISQFVAEETADESFRAAHPLREAEITVEDTLDEVSTGELKMVLRLAPHFQLDQVAANVKLHTRFVRSD